jgi:hypothetical protein
MDQKSTSLYIYSSYALLCHCSSIIFHPSHPSTSSAQFRPPHLLLAFTAFFFSPFLISRILGHGHATHASLQTRHMPNCACASILILPFFFFLLLTQISFASSAQLFFLRLVFC